MKTEPKVQMDMDFHQGFSVMRKMKHDPSSFSSHLFGAYDENKHFHVKWVF